MEKQIKILIIEDDFDISEVLRLQLELKNYLPQVAGSLEAAKLLLTDDNTPDLFLIDRMLPDSSGTEICQMLKKDPKHKDTPIILITAMGEPENVIEGLDAGADDYITKPFDINILHARVRAQLRRSEMKTATKKSNIITTGEISVDIEKCNVKLDGNSISLTHTEFQILSTLLQNPGIVYSREKLIHQILGDEVHVTNRTIDTHIAGLRKKLKNAANYIETIRGVGYRLKENEA